MRKTFILLSLFLSSVMGSLPSFAQAYLIESDNSILSEGGVISRAKTQKNEDGTKAGSVFAAIDIDAPPDIVWQVMVDCVNAPKIVPKMKSCEIISSEANESGQITSDERRHVLSMSRLWPKTVNEFRSDYTFPHSIDFKRTGGDLKVMQGRWELISLDDNTRTRVLYNSQLATNVPLPKFLLNNALKKDTPKILKSVREESIALLADQQE